MTVALSGSFPGVEVTEVEVLLRDDGTNRRARLGLTHAGADGPSKVFLKAPDPAHAELNARTGGLFNEARLFRVGASLPVEHPAVYLSLIDEPNLDFLLVMEDITEKGGDPRDAIRPLTVDEAAHGVSGLAQLHSRYWGARLETEPALAWIERFVAWRGMGRGVQLGIERVGDRIPQEVVAMAGERIEGLWARYIDSVNQGTPTLLHGDAHIGNTYVLPGSRLGFLDWQVIRRGDHLLDLGYFLQGALTVEDRRRHEADLVEQYLNALDTGSDHRPTRADVWLRYRASVAHGLTLWLATAASTGQRPEVSAALAERYATAFADLDSELAIEQLAR